MPDDEETAMTTSTILQRSFVCLFFAAVLLSAGCLGQEQAPAVEGPAPEFRGETFNYDDRVIFRFIPETDEAGTYSVNYILEQGVSWGTTRESRENVIFANVSRANPIEFVLPRESPSDTAAVEIEIRSTAGVLLYKSRIAVTPVTPTPTLP
ncbi:hypothetical protein F8E02_04840 [Methanoculleus sp. Wushi-C6]|uniref:Uncharacterized protein n=1 Tax=Methanoculleus caldifontis TaxID=2651577 RepID=A0ABU3WZW7_9EURY|nr:hypothetical protein [Methanoculleus sp. Wushi-C6]MDV2481344.1 hypothetical protein [Methanoculleus sp. Wushi-C6]